MAQLKKKKKKTFSIKSICYTSDVWPHKNNPAFRDKHCHRSLLSSRRRHNKHKNTSVWSSEVCENFVRLKFSHTSDSKQCESGDTQPFQKYKVWSTSWATWWKAASLTDMILEILFFFFSLQLVGELFPIFRSEHNNISNTAPDQCRVPTRDHFM